MSYLAQIHDAQTAPAKLEDLYHSARNQNELEAFTQAIEPRYQEEPENLLLAAWHYRLLTLKEELGKSRRSINWKWAVPLCLLNALVFWLLSAPELVFPQSSAPFLALLAGPIIAVFTIIFLTVQTPRKTDTSAWFTSTWSTSIWVSLLLVGITTYAMFLAYNDEGYQMLLLFHLPLISWVAVGITVLGTRSSADDRFAFLIKSIEVLVTAGLMLICGVIFGAITLGLFAAVSVELPDTILRLIAAGGAGLIPVIAVAIAYDPMVPAREQDFSQGLGKLIATLPRLLLPLALGVLVIYLFVIPFNFLEPYQNRDVLIVYNVMLFAVLGMLLGATPIKQSDLTERNQNILRAIFLAVAGLVVVVSLYAFSAVLYRTFANYLTMNRLTVIGWNLINTALLVWMIVRMVRSDRSIWVEKVQGVFSAACGIYLVWGLFIILAIPLIF